MIEDSATEAHAGVAAGKAVMDFVLNTPRANFIGVTDILFDDMSELPALLQIDK